MLNKKDVEILRGILHENNLQLREELRGEWQSELSTTLAQHTVELRQDLQADWRQDMKSIFVQYGNDLKREIREEMHALFVTFENKITTNIGELLDASVLPQIAELQKDMTLVKRHLQLV